MTYKIKSFIYLACFVIASVLYYGVEQEDKFQEQVTSASVAETDFEDAEELEDSQKDFVTDLE